MTRTFLYFQALANTIYSLSRLAEESVVWFSKEAAISPMYQGSGWQKFKSKKKNYFGPCLDRTSILLPRLPPGYYPYLGQMPGNRDQNRGGDQGYGQGGYNSLNRGNQVDINWHFQPYNLDIYHQIIRVGGQDLGPGLRAQYPPQPGDGGCVVRSVSVSVFLKLQIFFFSVS